MAKVDYQEKLIKYCDNVYIATSTLGVRFEFQQGGKTVAAIGMSKQMAKDFLMVLKGKVTA